MYAARDRFALDNAAKRMTRARLACNAARNGAVQIGELAASAGRDRAPAVRG